MIKDVIKSLDRLQLKTSCCMGPSRETSTNRWTSFILIWGLSSLLPRLPDPKHLGKGSWISEVGWSWNVEVSFCSCCSTSFRTSDWYTSIAARGGGGSFKRLKLYNSEEHLPIESFVTTLIHWTFFSDDANQVGICWLCRSGQLHVTPSPRWSLPRCHRSVRNDMRLFLRTKQYPVQLRTTKFWKVLPQYYSVLQSTTPESTTPVLLRTTKYYKVLVQYYSVLQSTTPVLLRTTKY